jgi:hypothetical protein
MEELIESFPTIEERKEGFKSFIFQPEKISLNSEQDYSAIEQSVVQNQYSTENYSQFKNQLQKPALNVKSIQLNRATIPNAVTSIPNNESIFVYRRINNSGAPDYSPLYNQGGFSSSFRFVRLLRTDDWTQNDPIFYDLNKTPADFGFNTTFPNYQALVDALNKAAVNDPLQVFVPPLVLQQFYIANDVKFEWDETTNKIILIPLQGTQTNGSGNTIPQYYYAEVGYEDPLLPQFLATAQTTLSQYMNPGTFIDLYRPLNVRLGFPWNGILPPVTDPIYPTILSTRMRPVPDFLSTPWTPILNYYAQSFGNLVYTQNVFIYCDIVGGSSENTGDDLPLLAVIPISTGQLGVNTFEAKTLNPLTKITNQVYQITIVMKTDTGSPFELPNGAAVNLELSLTY